MGRRYGADAGEEGAEVSWADKSDLLSFISSALLYRSVVPFDTAKGTESRPGRNRKRRFPPDPHPYHTLWGAAASLTSPLLRIALNFRFQRKQSIAKSTYAFD